MMPLTFSVADGIALGFITYVALKAGTGKYKEISVSLWVLCAIFIAKFIFQPLGISTLYFMLSFFH